MANKLTANDISEIQTQDDLISKFVRDNFTNLKNKTNEVIDELSAVTIGTTNAETTAARPYHTALLNRLDSIEENKENIYGRTNYLKYGGTVTINGSDTSKVDVAAGEAKVDASDVNWAAATSASISAAAAGNHRVDVVAVDSSNNVIVVTGAETLKASTNPAFPTIATTRLSLAALYVDDTGSVDLTSNIYQITDDNNFPNYYIKQATTLYEGKYTFNNLIVDNTISLDCSNVTGKYIIIDKNVKITCTGNLYVTSGNSISVDTTNQTPERDGQDGTEALNTRTGQAGGASGFGSFKQLSLAAGVGGDGSNAINKGGTNIDGGGGGGGGASIIAAGGSGKNGAAVLVGTSGAVNPRPGGDAVGAGNFLLVRAKNMDIDGTISANGGAGGDGDSHSGTSFLHGGAGGGAGGGGGGIVILICQDDFTLSASGSVTANGGDGGDGGDSTNATETNAGGGGGGGGAGGLVLIRYQTATVTGSITANAGAGGAAGIGSGGTLSNQNGTAGDNGTAGVTENTVYNSLGLTDFSNLYSPISSFGVEI